MERRGIDELIVSGILGSGNWMGVEEVTPSLQVGTLV
jgi:hypothetical protein